MISFPNCRHQGFIHFCDCVCVFVAGFEPLAPPPPPSATAVPVWQDRTIASSKLRMLEYSAFMEVQRDPDNVSENLLQGFLLPDVDGLLNRPGEVREPRGFCLKWLLRFLVGKSQGSVENGVVLVRFCSFFFCLPDQSFCLTLSICQSNSIQY